MALSKEELVRNITDRVIRESLKHPENLRGLLEQVVPDLVDDFDFPQAQLLERDFPVDDWRCREADLPFCIPYRLGDQTIPALIVVLIEHQSDTDPLMPLRLLYFAVVWWDKQWKEWAALPPPRPALRLHPVLPIVMYTGQTAWGSNRTLVELLGEPEAFHAFAPTWEPLFWNLADRTPEDLLATTNAWLNMLSALRAENEEPGRFREIYLATVQKLLALAPQDMPRWYDLMRALFTWALSRRTEDEYNELVQTSKQQMPSAQIEKEFNEMIAKKLGPSALENAWDEGEAEGQAKGQIKAWQDSLKMCLSSRFVSVPEPIAQQIDAVNDPERLKEAMQRALQCQSLDEFQL